MSKTVNQNGTVKSFVIDTNVFIHKPDAISSFRDNEVIIPLAVLEELDNLKRFSDEKGRNARHAIRFLDAYASRGGSLHQGVKMDNGSLLKVVRAGSTDLPVDLKHDKADNRIIQTALDLQAAGRQVFFVSKDINARVKAEALGLQAVDYEKQKVDINSMYQGWREIQVKRDTFEKFKIDKKLDWRDALKSNEFALLKTADENEVLLGRYMSQSGEMRLIPNRRFSVSGIKPLNIEQKMAFELLLDDSIPLITLLGQAGTGKTLIALAAGMVKVTDEAKYNRLLVSRPVIPMGKDIGYLPGDKDEKLSHWMQPIFDNLDYILGINKKKDEEKGVDWFIKNNLIEIEALTYIRGRSLPDQFLIVDEAQNLSPHEIKTIVSRAGRNTKVILTGDPYQIDSPYLDSNSNGLSYLVEAFKGQPLYGHVTLSHTERSDLAELAAQLL
ncbi:MAG: PhoH family protein [Spirochaetales bacterium]|uniref:PhoH family protein n=1 Tax=Candidatus Thalassospirochaeta sargassi TaxID=3119039 RepID=A0AAJ1ICD1_9SPIO|nr:PhoH family protein [Spirochaetales bacterium]